MTTEEPRLLVLCPKAAQNLDLFIQVARSTPNPERINRLFDEALLWAEIDHEAHRSVPYTGEPVVINSQSLEQIRSECLQRAAFRD